MLWIAANVVLWAVLAGWDEIKIHRKHRQLERQAEPFQLKSQNVSNQLGSSSEQSLPYLVYISQQSDTDPKVNVPLVVVLHGAGKRGDDGVSHLSVLGTFLTEPTNQQRHPCCVVAPQCPTGSTWVHSPTIDFQDVLLNLIESIADRHPIDRDRVYLIGYSMGAYGCWHFAASMPDQFAGVIAVAGGGRPENANALCETPIWAIHGENDQIVPCVQSELMVNAVVEAGGEAKLSLLPNIGHDSMRVVHDVPNHYIDWLFSLSRN